MAVLYGLGCLAYYLPPQVATWLSLLGFTVPIALFILLLFLLYWFAQKSKKALLSLVCLIMGYFFFGWFYQFSFTENDEVEDAFSLMSYNVRSLNHNEQLQREGVGESIINYIFEESPDVLLLQEADYGMRRTTALDSIYPHKFVDFEYGVPRNNRVVNALFSKFPIVNTGIIKFNESNNAAIYVDVVMPNDTVRIFNVHMQSFNVVPDVEHLQNEESGKLLKRVVRVLNKQEEQAKLIHSYVTNSPYPVILGGDFNNVQFSKMHRTMKGHLNDSFLAAGSGFGRTYKLFNLPVRIDYILSDNRFEAVSHINYDIELSDHYPVMAELVLKPNK